MEDLIKREDAIEAIEVTDWYHQNRNKDMVSGANSDEHQAWYKADDIYKALESVPTADRPSGEWVPCSERLPSEDEQDSELGVIVTLGNGYSGLQYDWYHDGYWYDWDGFVIAWMPLPRPYNGARMKGADDE